MFLLLSARIYLPLKWFLLSFELSMLNDDDLLWKGQSHNLREFFIFGCSIRFLARSVLLDLGWSFRRRIQLAENLFIFIQPFLESCFEISWSALFLLLSYILCILIVVRVESFIYYGRGTIISANDIIIIVLLCVIVFDVLLMNYFSIS